jgi:3'(2'), 5'-bisphosphate nucleotidase
VPDKNVLYLALDSLGSYKTDSIDRIEAINSQVIGSAAENIAEAIDSIIDASTTLPASYPTNRPFTIIGSRSHASPELEAFVEEKRQEHGEVEFISAGSSLKLCLVAEGKADIYPRTGPTMEWDTAAGQAIAQNAGCKVLQYDTNEPLIYNKENLLNPWFVVLR